jgi:peptidoglycan/xylan/chitin deacetylase (PgdA/CDA1 family)
MESPSPTALRVPGVNPRKRQLARLLDRAGALHMLLRAQARWNGPYLRCVNYHSVPPAWADDFARQLVWLREHFVPVGLSDLLELHAGRWPHARPGILVSFDDGCRTHAEVAAPLLEEHGFVGWFFVTAGFPDVPVAEQAAFAREHAISACSPDGDPRVALTWDQVRHLDRHHVVGCHTLEHVRLSSDVGEEELRRQIVGGKQRLEEQLGHPVDTFAWVGGEEWSYSAPAARLIAEAGFRVALGTNNQPYRSGRDLLRIERTNVEAFYELELLRFQLCGVLDLAYAPKRRRLRRALAG